MSPTSKPMSTMSGAGSARAAAPGERSCLPAQKSDLGDLARHPDERGRSPMFDGRPASIMEEDEEESPGPVGAPEAVDTALRCNINRRPDIVWQENPPRVLKYRTSHLHYWGE